MIADRATVEQRVVGVERGRGDVDGAVGGGVEAAAAAAAGEEDAPGLVGGERRLHDGDRAVTGRELGHTLGQPLRETRDARHLLETVAGEEAAALSPAETEAAVAVQQKVEVSTAVLPPE